MGKVKNINKFSGKRGRKYDIIKLWFRSTYSVVLRYTVICLQSLLFSEKTTKHPSKPKMSNAIGFPLRFHQL